MNRIQTRTAPPIRLISFTVDPARDTPSVLTAYAHRFSASPERWTFLTGDRSTLQILDRDAFKLGNLDEAFEHSTRFAMVDQQGRIRAYYSFGEENMIDRAAHDAEVLSGESL